MRWLRRDFLKTVWAALPAGTYLSTYETLVAQEKGKVRIKDVKAIGLRGTGNCLVKVETDAGITGYGEAGSTGAMARARIATFKQFLMGQDPLAIERHFSKLTSQAHTYVAHIPTISGVDIALWDIAGKILGRPVSTLMGGPFRNQIRLYINTSPRDMLDAASCREWAQRMNADPQGWSTFKIAFMQLLKTPVAQLSPTLVRSDLSRLERAFANVREAIGPEKDIVVHCHNEFNLPSAIGIAQAVEPTKPAWLEDAMPVAYTDSWATLRRQTRVPILTGEKLELPRQFQPFLQNQAVDIVQPDLAFCGGITGARKIADLAALYNVPVNTHNVGTVDRKSVV